MNTTTSKAEGAALAVQHGPAFVRLAQSLWSRPQDPAHGLATVRRAPEAGSGGDSSLAQAVRSQRALATQEIEDARTQI